VRAAAFAGLAEDILSTPLLTEALPQSWHIIRRWIYGDLLVGMIDFPRSIFRLN
jgi:hypothetical protein